MYRIDQSVELVSKLTESLEQLQRELITGRSPPDPPHTRNKLVAAIACGRWWLSEIEAPAGPLFVTMRGISYRRSRLGS
jgi:hypothetical protein